VRIGVLLDSSLMATRVGSIRLVTCASPTYLAKHRTPETPQELPGAPAPGGVEAASGSPPLVEAMLPKSRASW